MWQKTTITRRKQTYEEIIGIDSGICGIYRTSGAYRVIIEVKRSVFVRHSFSFVDKLSICVL